MRVVVTGAAGQLGAVIVRVFASAGHDVVPFARAELDITRHDEVMSRVTAATPAVVINCAAFNDVEGAESQYAPAFDINAFAVRSLARAARESGATFVHYSTDFVFDGKTDRPYSELDRVSPQSVYASSKYLGERFAEDVDRHYVLRVESLFGGPAARSSIDRIAQNLAAGREARVFVDRVVSPSYTDDVALATERLLALGAPAGLYHCVNSGHATWFELARELARLMGLDEGLLAGVRVADVPLRACRPQFAALANAKLAAVGIRMPSWRDAVARYLASATASRV